MVKSLTELGKMLFGKKFGSPSSCIIQEEGLPITIEAKVIET